jgi:hypothetical protein
MYEQMYLSGNKIFMLLYQPLIGGGCGELMVLNWEHCLDR